MNERVYLNDPYTIDVARVWKADKEGTARPLPPAGQRVDLITAYEDEAVAALGKGDMELTSWLTERATQIRVAL